MIGTSVGVARAGAGGGLAAWTLGIGFSMAGGFRHPISGASIFAPSRRSSCRCEATNMHPKRKLVPPSFGTARDHAPPRAALMVKLGANLLDSREQGLSLWKAPPKRRQICEYLGYGQAFARVLGALSVGVHSTGGVRYCRPSCSGGTLE